MKIYSKLLTQAEKAHNAIKHSGLSMNSKCPPLSFDETDFYFGKNISK